MTATHIQVQLFLREFKMAAGKEISYSRREKNWDTLVNLNMTSAERNDCVMRLTWRDYCQGPMEEHNNRPGEIWVFGVKLGEKEIYIKLRLFESIAACISFHEADSLLHYPFGEKNA